MLCIAEISTAKQPSVGYLLSSCNKFTCPEGRYWVTSPIHLALWVWESCADSPYPPLCESFRCEEGGNLAAALIRSAGGFSNDGVHSRTTKQILHSSNKREMTHKATLKEKKKKNNNSNLVTGCVFGNLHEENIQQLYPEKFVILSVLPTLCHISTWEQHWRRLSPNTGDNCKWVKRWTHSMYY